MVDARTVVIVGASLAGAKAAEELRSQGFAGRVVLIGEESERPYERPPLSKGYLQGNDARDTIYVHEQQWYADHAIELKLGVPATRIDRDGKLVELSDGTRQPYDKLLLTTGSTVRRLPGDPVAGVHYLRTVQDADALREAFARAGRVVVVGAGWIGLEGAAAARAHGCDVTLIEPDPAPLNRVFGAEIGGVFARLHRAHGVDLRNGVGLDSVRAGPVVVTTRGEGLPADAVLVGIGILPAVTLAGQAGLEVDNGIRVTDRLQTTRDPDIYAAGDCANADHLRYGRSLRVEHWANALNAGPAAARNLLGADERYDRIPYFFSDQYELGLEFSGWFDPAQETQVVYRGDPDTNEFCAFWLDRDDRVLAGMNVNVWNVVESIQELVRARVPVDPDRLADPNAPLN